MRAVVQRVADARVSVASQVVGSIDLGLLVLLCVMQQDNESDAAYLAKKVAGLRIFADGRDRMNRSLVEVGGSVLAVSQFTLAGDARRGNRPSFGAAAEPEVARELFLTFCAELRNMSVSVETGRFREHMAVSLTNDGPITILLDSHRNF